jgi:pimeloyl-ACP methyl ester carboxylesterase
VHSDKVAIPFGNIELAGTLQLPRDAHGLVIFAHGSGSSRFSPRNLFVAEFLNTKGFGTLLMDLLTPAEEELDAVTGTWRFNISLLSQRVGAALEWLAGQQSLQSLPLGLFGASTGAAAALVAAATHSERVKAVVSRGGRPDLAGNSLALVSAPTLLIVGSNDLDVLTLNRNAMMRMTSITHLHIVPGASHLFEEPGTLEQVAQQAAQWFARYLRGRDATADAVKRR